MSAPRALPAHVLAAAERARSKLRTTPASLDGVRCFACDKPLTNEYRLADTRDDQIVRVGPDCMRRVVEAGASGYQPPKGGPRLWPIPARPAPTKPARRGVMNKTEWKYAVELEARQLAGELRWWRFEAMKLRLGTGAWYVPDFSVLLADGSLEQHEVKGGHIREAAMVRLKVAASLYPFKFWLVCFTKDGQTAKEIRP